MGESQLQQERHEKGAVSLDVNELMQEEDLRTALEQAGSSAEIAAILHEKGFELSAAEVENAVSQKSGEMTEKELETVSGGGIWSPIWYYIKALRRKAAQGGENGALGGGGFAGGGSR